MKTLVIMKQLPPLSKILYENPCNNKTITAIIKGFIYKNPCYNKANYLHYQRLCMETSRHFQVLQQAQERTGKIQYGFPRTHALPPSWKKNNIFLIF